MLISEIPLYSTVKVIVKTKYFGNFVEGIIQRQDGLYVVICPHAVTTFHPKIVQEIKYDEMGRIHHIYLKI